MLQALLEICAIKLIPIQMQNYWGNKWNHSGTDTLNISRKKNGEHYPTSRHGTPNINFGPRNVSPSGCEFSVDHIQIFWLLTQKDKWNNFSVLKTVKVKIPRPLPVTKWFQNYWHYSKRDRWSVWVSEQSLGKYVVIKIMGMPSTERFRFVEVCSDFTNTL